MKKLLDFLGIIMTIIMVICDITEFLAVPALFIVNRFVRGGVYELST